MKNIEFRIDHKELDYLHSTRLMEDRCKKIHEGSKRELVWFLKHPAIYTAGSSARKEDLLSSNIPVFNSSRGGQHTYHDPGQRIIYLILNIKNRGINISQYMDMLHSWIIETLGEVSVIGIKHKPHVGVWVKKPDGKLCKICAMGVKLHKGDTTSHGIALNISPNLNNYGGIVPCGISDSDLGVTSLEDLRVNVSMEDLDKILKEKFPFT